jgi:hypothetical protein
MGENKKSNNLPIPDNIQKMDVKKYGTSPEDFKLWVDILFEKFKKVKVGFPIPAIIFGLIAYSVGLLISMTISFQKEYIATFPIYIGTFGIMWVTAILSYGSRKFHTVYEELRPCFLINDDDYSELIKKWFTNFSHKRRNFLGILILSFIAFVFVYITLYRPEFFGLINSNSLREVFPPTWYQNENRFGKAIILSVWGIFVAYPMGTATRLIILNFFFLLKLRNLHVIPIPSMVKARLHTNNNLYIFISSTWFVGVGLFGILLFDKLDLISVLFLALFSLFGTFTFLTPQLIYRRFLAQSQKVVSHWVLYSFYNSLNIELIEKPMTKIPIEHGANLTKMDDLKEFIEVSKTSDAWVYDPTDFIFLLLGQVVSFGSVFFIDIIKNIFS